MQNQGNTPRQADQAEDETDVEGQPLYLPWPHRTTHELQHLHIHVRYDVKHRLHFILNA